MPEFPDLTVYLEAIDRDLLGQTLERVRIASPFLLRTHDPQVTVLQGKRLVGTRRLGKRLVFAFEEELFLVLHLMVAGRLRLKPKGDAIVRKVGLAAFDFESASLSLTEASPKKRASLHLVRGDAALHELDPGGIEPMSASLAEFAAQLRRENHTLKRSLTDPHFFAAIGNAYSDEILHRAKLSPVQLTSRIDDASIARLFECTHAVLEEWTARLRKAAKGRFPDKVTAFQDAMAVHGKFGQPCPVCGTAVQRIRRASNEVNYCPTCQTGGKLLADRSLSRLLHDDWPETLEELEEMKQARRNP
ncbi:MAG: DNA-(apurinic or apyrimidinic site) lyase [Myxococcaceae bacterium]|nr:DNA-(apurinic or apyrimidinic site) lyase [Myxococcaceae bacterium]